MALTYLTYHAMSDRSRFMVIGYPEFEASSRAPFSSALFNLPVRDGFRIAVEVDADFHDRQTAEREA